jgi:hypothetical protein
VVSTQLTHESLIVGGGYGTLDRALPDPSVAVDVVTDHRSAP